VTTTPEELLGMADELFASRNRGDKTPRRMMTLIGEIPIGPARMLTVTRKSDGFRPPILRIRGWTITPKGDRFPLTSFGFDLPVDALPQFAAIVASALAGELDQLPAWADISQEPWPPPADKSAEEDP
jgi:hypothetical protein